jgi:SAM-dependent methyltransferase
MLRGLMPSHSDPFEAWFEALYARHTERLRFAEIRRALQALSTVYVQRRDRLASGGALDGDGKRAAFALFYAPLHFLRVRAIVCELGAAPPPRVVDLGCGTGVAGAAWALQGASPASVLGLDVNRWALAEATWNWQTLGLRGRAVRADAGRWCPREPAAVVAAYTLNELGDTARRELLSRLAGADSPFLVVEPIAKTISPWWEEAAALPGARSDVWRLCLPLPEKLALLGRAAGLDVGTLTARSLYRPARSTARREQRLP